jgi:hypothetical protein
VFVKVKSKVDSLQEELIKIYMIFVDTCARNPLYKLGTPITCSNFVDSLNDFLKKNKLI